MNSISKNKRKKLCLCTILGTVFAMAVVFLVNSTPILFGNADTVEEHTITFNQGNGGTGFPSSYGSGVNNSGHTSLGNSISFTYSNAKSTSNKFCTLASGGYLYNSTTITGLESVNVTFSGGSLSLYSSKSTTFSGSAKSLTSGTPLSIDANYNYFKLLASGETAIESITVYYTCAAREEPVISDVTDTITASDLTATGTSYSDFSGVTKSSDAVYAGNSAKDSSGNIQMRSKSSNSGIVSTVSGGTVKSVTITVGSGSNTIDVYGSNSAYSDATDLYGNSAGTKVGSVTSTGTVSFSGEDYAYVGIRSNNGAIYVTSIDIVWTTSGGSGGGDTPTPTPDPEALDLTASFPYANTYPTSINILREDESVFGTLSTSISAVKTYMDNYSEYEIAKNEYILIENSNPNVTITSIDVKMYQYRNFDVYVDGSSSYIYHGDGGRDTSSDPLIINVEVNASSSVKLVSNGGSGSYSWKVYGVDIYLSGTEGDVSVTGVSLNKSSTTIAQGNNEQLTATVAPSYATNKDVSWSSSNTNVATVSNTGLVTAVSAGSATITVTTDDGGFTATCNVTVTAVYHVTGVSLSPTALALHPGEQSALTATIAPSNATNKNISWSTSNSSVATVSSGTVNAVAAGTATITVTTEDGGYTATCSVTVTNVAVTGVTLNKNSLTLTRLDSETLTATVAPSNATNKNINWTSSNTNVATVSNTGLVTAVSAGTATITATSAESSSIKATCTVTVNPIAVSSVSLNKNALSLGVGNSETLTATVSPSNADNTNVTWSTSDSSVATVSNGTVTGVSEGSATITATSVMDNTKTAECLVTVSAVTDVTIDLTAQGFSNQQEVTTVTQGSFTLTFDQASGTNPPKYYTSGTSVRTYANNTLTVETSGSDKITKIVFTLGTTTSATPSVDTGSYDSSSKTWTGSATSITFTNASSGQYHYKTVTITVTPSTPVAATGVSLPATQEIGIGSSVTLPVTYTPSNANTGLAVTWSKVSGSNKISVDSNGKVSVDSSATSSDTAVVRVTLTSNSAYANCTITVVEVAKAKYTVLLYLCGSTLEYDSDYKSLDGAASDDMGEILSASGTYKSDVNFVIETGGSQKWEPTYGVSKDKLEVRHVSGNSYAKDSPSTITSQANMGEASTLQTFLEYGLSTYPAEKTALILWDHGGAMTGVCCDDNYSMECLTAAEVKSAVSGALSNSGMSGQKLEWIGYDACLMAVADIASVNSDYFNYMVASQETEPGDGWDYTSWVSTLYNNPTNTRTILEGITTSYQSFYNGYSNTRDATLAAYDLSYMSAFTTAFENFASHLTDSNWSKLTTAFNNSLQFGVTTDNNVDHYLYGIADMNNFMANVTSQISSLSTYTQAVITAMNNLVIYNKYCTDYNSMTYKPCGICVFMGYTASTVYWAATVKADYTTNDTKFSTWRSYNIKNGEWKE